MYNTENPYKSAGEYLKAPLFEKYQLRRAAVKTSTALFPFMLFAAIFAFIILILGKVFPSLLDGLYWVSYMSVQLFGIGMSICMAYYAGGFFSALVSGVLAEYSVRDLPAQGLRRRYRMGVRSAVEACPFKDKRRSKARGAYMHIPPAA